jgi:hypothetical protein
VGGQRRGETGDRAFGFLDHRAVGCGGGGAEQGAGTQAKNGEAKLGEHLGLGLPGGLERRGAFFGKHDDERRVG